MITSNTKKQQARVSILERLKQKGVPVSPFPGEQLPEEAMVEEETLSSFGLADGEAMNPAPQSKRKKRPLGL